jgi:menaquinone-dependent protoporphyrinogen oxidase
VTTVLAVYGSAYGQTEKIVRRIADRLTGCGLGVTLHRADALPAALDLAGFDAVLVGASVMVGKHQPYVHRFVEQHAARLNAMPSAFVSVSGSAGSPLPAKRADAQDYLETFLRRTSWRPTRTATFGGALAYTKYGWFMRWLIKRISKQSGAPTDTSRDHDLTDWNAVDQFAADWAKTMLHAATP